MEQQYVSVLQDINEGLQLLLEAINKVSEGTATVEFRQDTEEPRTFQLVMLREDRVFFDLGMYRLAIKSYLVGNWESREQFHSCSGKPKNIFKNKEEIHKHFVTMASEKNSEYFKLLTVCVTPNVKSTNKTWHAQVIVDLGELSLEDIRNEPKYYKKFFADLENPTKEEIRKYFEKRQQSYAESNTGSEELAAGDLEIIDKD